MTTQPLADGTLPIEAIAELPAPGMAIPGAIAWSPDDGLVTFLWSPERTLVRQLYAVDPATGERRLLVAPPGGASEESISLEEALRRERARQRELGITRYAWAEHADVLLLP